jgi:hypothetical protein
MGKNMSTLKGGIMYRSFKILTGFAAVALVVIALPSAPVMAASQTFQGAVMDVAADPDPGFCLKSRTWSGADNGNFNKSVCPSTGNQACGLESPPFGLQDNYCDRLFTTNVVGSTRPGFTGHQDDILNYAAGADNQPVYMLMDSLAGRGTTAYVGYYASFGQIAGAGELGKISVENCAGTTAVSCFDPATDFRVGAAQAGTKESPDLAPTGGLNPIPEPTITGTGTAVTMSWAPIFESLKDGAPSVFKHYKVYRYTDASGNNVCEPPTDASMWSLIGSSATTSFSDPAPPTGVDCWAYALRLTWNGPSALQRGPDAMPGEVTSFNRGAASAPVSGNPLAVQITNFDASYQGKGVVGVTWTGQIESGITGYRVGRSLSLNGPFTRTGDLIQARGDGSVYTISDRVGRPDNGTVYYQLQILNADGSKTTLGPVSATVPTPKRADG